jgi:hypothetical protein
MIGNLVNNFEVETVLYTTFCANSVAYDTYQGFIHNYF